MRVDRSVGVCPDHDGRDKYLFPLDTPPIELLGHPPEDMKRAESERCLGRAVLHAVGGRGTVMRRSFLTKYAISAGFGEVEILPIEDFSFFRFCWLR
jgi:hypothetical protein